MIFMNAGVPASPLPHAALAWLGVAADSQPLKHRNLAGFCTRRERTSVSGGKRQGGKTDITKTRLVRPSDASVSQSNSTSQNQWSRATVAFGVIAVWTGIKSCPKTGLLAPLIRQSPN